MRVRELSSSLLGPCEKQKTSATLSLPSVWLQAGRQNGTEFDGLGLDWGRQAFNLAILEAFEKLLQQGPEEPASSSSRAQHQSRYQQASAAREGHGPSACAGKSIGSHCNDSGGVVAAVERGVAGGGASCLDGWRLRSRADVPWLFMSRRCCPVKGAAGPEKLPQEPGSRGASSIRGGAGPLFRFVQGPLLLVHCQSLLARDAIGGGRANHHSTVPRQKSRASQSAAELGRRSRPPAMPMPESIPTPGRPASSTPSACDRYLACRKKRPGASKVGHVWRTARVGGAETQGQLPLTDPVPKPTPDVVITCTRRVPLHDSRHELVHGTIATQCCWKLELKPWATRLELESQRPMWRLECDGSQLWTWRDST